MRCQSQVGRCRAMRVRGAPVVRSRVRIARELFVLLPGGELGMEVGFAVGKENDFEAAFLAFRDRGTADQVLLAVSGCVLDFERTTALKLNAVVEGGIGGEGVVAETGVGVVDFEELDCAAGAVLYRGFDVVGAATGETCKDCEKEQG
jgi:hypothetical protein